MSGEYLKPKIFTIGYQGRSVDDFIRLILDQSVDSVIDVRLRPSSRKPGFSKSRLEAACTSAGLQYLHDRALGTPAEILDTYRKTGQYNWDDFVAHLDERPEILEGAIEIASNSATCLLCFEADPMECHRRFLADRLANHLDITRIDL